MSVASFKDTGLSSPESGEPVIDIDLDSGRREASLRVQGLMHIPLGGISSYVNATGRCIDAQLYGKNDVSRTIKGASVSS